ncbi:hypothetical protein DQ04_16691000 [Trypanosoma grayi]|uniref:hypothetical protein n=1 Tax=Trypanosoma grayi TaxID=71804 RepID=UPI0004F47C57|nr:hypothetical protein DQ04_16691000 [Trypanosoma grayi]KEG05998.1 hypothetical protein DQ04_16691000 [Trypanosoma grayi]
MGGRLEAKLQRDLRRLELSIEERAASAVEAVVEERVAVLEERVAKAQAPQGVGEATQALARDVQAYRAKVESLSSALAKMQETTEQKREEFVLLRDWATLRKAVSALESQLRDCQSDAVDQQLQLQHTCKDHDVKLRQLEGEQRRLRQTVQQLQGNFGELCADVQMAQRPAPVAAVMGRSLPTTTAAVVHRTDPAPSVEFREVLSSDTHANTAQASSSGTTATPTPHTHPQTSSTDVMILDDRNESPDARPLPPSLARLEGVGRHGSTPTTATTASHRLSSSSWGSTAGVQQKTAWGGAGSSNSDTSLPLQKGMMTPQQRLRATITTTAAAAAHDDAGNEKKNTRGEDDVENKADSDDGEGRRDSLMQPPHESSSSAGSAIRVSRKQHAGGGYDSVSESNSSVVKPFAPPDGRDESVSGAFTTPKKTPAAAAVATTTTTTTEEVTPPVKRTAAWYDDWDDPSDDETAAPLRQQQRQQQQRGRAEDGAAVVVEDSWTDAAGALHAGEIYATPRKAFVSAGDDAAATSKWEEEVSVPRHGVATSSGSSSADSKKRQQAQHKTPKRFTSFDDTTSEDEET